MTSNSNKMSKKILNPQMYADVRRLRYGARSVKLQFLLLILCVVFLPLASAHGESVPVSITDDFGNKVILKRPAERIITLYGGLTEIVCSLGLGPSLVGCTKRDNWPQEVRDKPRVGTHMRPNLELILGLRPDLVLQGSSRAEALLTVEQLRLRGIPVAVFNPVSFSGLFSTIERIGILSGRQKDAGRMVEQIGSRLDSISKKYPQVANRPKIFFEVSYPNLLSAGSLNIVNDIINKAGGENVVKVPKRLVRYSFEALLSDAPDVYIIQQGPMNRTITDLSKRPNFGLLPAVRKDRVLVVEEFLFSRPGPRSVEAVEQLAAYLHSGQEEGS